MRTSFKKDECIHLQQKHKNFEALAIPFKNQIHGAALRLTKNPLDAEDLFQDTYLKAYRFFHRFEGITKNRVISGVKRSNSR